MSKKNDCLNESINTCPCLYKLFLDIGAENVYLNEKYLSLRKQHRRLLGEYVRIFEKPKTNPRRKSRVYYKSSSSRPKSRVGTPGYNNNLNQLD